MIAKNIKAQAFAGVVNYVMKKDAEVLKTEGVMAMSAKDMITSFELQRSVRSEIKSPVGHIPISYAPEDKERMTNQFMIQLAEEYMEKMGIKDTQYIIVRHHDNENPHCHIVYNRIDNIGKLITDKNDYKRNEKACKELKDKYNLTYGRGKQRVRLDKLQPRERVKHEIYRAIVKEILECTSVKELENRLINHGINTEYKYKRGTDEVQGISFSKSGYTFKGSQIDRMHSYKNLQLMLGEVVRMQQKTNVVCGKKLTIRENGNLLRGAKVWVEGLKTDDGTLFNSHIKLADDGKTIEVLNAPSHQEQSSQEQQQPQQDSTFISGSTGLFDLPADGGDDPEEAMFKNRMQQKTKKKKGRRM